MEKQHQHPLPSTPLNLDAEIAELRLLPALQSAGRVAKTLAVYPDFRIVLTAIRKGTRISEHQVPGRVSIQTVQGRIELHLANQVAALPAGSILVLDQGTTHDVAAMEESAFLVTIAWPSRD